MNTTIVHLNLDTLIAAMEARPATKARTKAWEYLSEVSAVTFDGDALIVPSATWSNTSYRATTTSCTCPARKPCHHMEVAQIVADARAEDARYDALAECVPFDLGADLIDYPPVAKVRSSSAAQALADLLECFN